MIEYQYIKLKRLIIIDLIFTKHIISQTIILLSHSVLSIIYDKQFIKLDIYIMIVKITLITHLCTMTIFFYINGKR